jgi:hypothetical protein
MLQALEAYYRDKASAYNQRIEAMAQEAQAYAAHEGDRVRLLDHARHLQALAAQAEYLAERDLLAAKAEQMRRQRATMQQTDEPSAFTPAAASWPSTDVLQPSDRVMIHAVGVSESDPIAREYVVEPNGSVALGPTYGRVQISGLSAEEAERAIVVHLEQMFKAPKVQITHADGAVRQTELESLREDVRALRALLEGFRREPQSAGPTGPGLRPGR